MEKQHEAFFVFFIMTPYFSQEECSMMMSEYEEFKEKSEM